MRIGDRQGKILQAMRHGVVTTAMAAESWGYDFSKPNKEHPWYDDRYTRTVVRRAVNETLHRMVMMKKLVHPERGIYAKSYHHYALFRLKDPEWVAKASDEEIAGMRALVAKSPAAPQEQSEQMDLFA